MGTRFRGGRANWRGSVASGGGSGGGGGGGGASSAVITWAQRRDDSNALITTDSFVIYSGQTQYGPYPNSLSISNASLATAPTQSGEVVYTHTFNGLASGTWYFVVSTVDAAGNESDPGNEITVVIA